MVEQCTMPFCKGCGHTHVLRKLDEALTQIQLPPHNVCLVSDIGCIGLSDALFKTPHTVHTTHGRSTAFATGIELADCILADSQLKTVVLIGDGGAMIGLLHLVQAALLNVDVTVLLCNNFLFGMTGGQNSAFSPLDFVTTTTPSGNIIPPLDICKVMMDAKAPFVARKLATDKNLGDIIAQAIHFPGFALVEIVELCTEYGVSKNDLSGNRLRNIVETHGLELGILRHETTRREFGYVYTSKFPRTPVQKTINNGTFQHRYRSNLDKHIGIVLAGSAGERVQSSAGKFCQAAATSGLHCTQKNDNPVTQGTGFSLSEICLSPHEIFYTAIERPDVVIAVSEDGLKELLSKRIFPTLSKQSLLIIENELPVPECDANVLHIPLRAICGGSKAAAGALALYLELNQVFPAAAFYETLQTTHKGNDQFFPDSFFTLLESVKASRR
jgi:pyruvate/2-oxoacid:ferredoxin oxidoreductase beta subunit